MSLGLNIGLKSLLRAQSALETIGHNISNANTPGYSRQSLEVSTTQSLRMRGLLMGTGVQADVVRRTVDVLLQGRLTRQVSSLGRLDTRLSSLTEAESFLGGTGPNGPSALLDRFFDGLSTLATAPEDAVLRNGAVQSTLELTSRLNGYVDDIQDLLRSTQSRLQSRVTQANELAREIGELNRRILTTEAGQYVANDLRDQRDEAIKQLAGMVDVRTVEDQRGAVRVLVDGYLLVSPTTVEQLRLKGDVGSGKLELFVGDSLATPGGGEIGGLFSVAETFLPGLGQKLDDFARSLILEVNRVHSTGMGAGGPFQRLTGTSVLVDRNKNGQFGDELLTASGLPFDVTSGALYVNMTDRVSGQVTKHKLSIDASRTTVSRLLADLNAIPHLSASIDGAGRVQVLADTGHGFDFSSRLDPNPDPIGSFGGGRASLGTGGTAPFALTAGDTIDLVGPSGAFTVTLNGGSFQQISSATAPELAAALNADAGVQANGLVATAVGDRVVLQSAGSGSSSTFTVAGGTALGALGWTAGTVVSGHATAVDAQVKGTYTGSGNGVFSFRPNMDGVIGTTVGLKVEVYDESGAQVAVLDVGKGYQPGDELDVLDGVSVAFGFGTLSATNNDEFRLDVVADSDTSDLLPALGLNALLTGRDAATIGVRKDIQTNPDLLAGSHTGAAGDVQGFLSLLDLQTTELSGLNGVTLGGRVGDIVSDVGLEVSSAQNAREAEMFLLDSLQARRDQVSGVNPDEELVLLIEHEQAFQAASQYIRVLSELNAELMNIL